MIELIATGFGILGLIIGSFLNVVIYRTPRKISLIKPGSKCSNCENSIKWYDNIPIISYFILRGKCRNCHNKISLRYPLVEAIVGLLYLASYLKFDLTIDFLLAIIFITAAIIIIFIDIDFKYIPDLLVIIIALLGVTQSVLSAIFDGVNQLYGHLFGLLFGFTAMLLIRVAGYVFYKKEALGFGDVKLMAASGLFLGFGNILLTMLFASILGAVVELSLLKLGKRKRGEEIPFGPYLIFAMFVTLFLGSDIINWYLSLLS